jgi:hypothetical protein
MFAFTSMDAQINRSLHDGNALPVVVINGENYQQIF